MNLKPTLLLILAINSLSHASQKTIFEFSDEILGDQYYAKNISMGIQIRAISIMCEDSTYKNLVDSNMPPLIGIEIGNTVKRGRVSRELSRILLDKNSGSTSSIMNFIIYRTTEVTSTLELAAILLDNDKTMYCGILPHMYGTWQKNIKKL